MNDKLKHIKFSKTNKITAAMIKDFLITHKEVLLWCVLALILYFIGSYRLDNAQMPILLDDEYGYWANSSFFMGIGWPSITQNIAYYSYGYSFILVLVRLAAGLIGIVGWASVYRLACVLNLLFIVCSFFIATRICRRYMHSLTWLTRNFVCFAVMLYPANTVYSHTTMTECVMTLLFWIILYIMMRVIDKPSIFNHIAFGVSSVVIYVFHQRALAVLITAVIIVIFNKMMRISKMCHVTAFSAALYACFLIQAVIKKNLQNVLYLGNPKTDFYGLMSYIFTKKAAVMLVAVIVMLLLLYLIEKGRVRLACTVIIVGCTVILVYILKKGILNGTVQVVNRIAMNDFAGQWEKIIGIFSKYGLIRLGTSIVGKWFYLAAATGLVICWGMRGLIVNAFWMTVDSVRRAFASIKRKRGKTLKRLEKDYRERIWFLGVFLAWVGTFLICAIYKEGLYKVDDLVHGRYIEFVIGIVIIYSVDRLLADRHWFIMMLVCLGLYMAAGWYCQYVYDELQRTQFELAHAVVFGRIFWNYQSPTGKIRELAGYVIPLSLSFIFLLKMFSSLTLKYRIHTKIVTIRCIVALMIPVLTWNHISYAIIDNYVCSRNDKQSGAMPQIAFWADILQDDEKIYFVNDWLSYKQASLIQFMLMDQVMEYTSFSQLSFDEDAVYIISGKMLDDPKIVEKCEIVRHVGSYAIVINRNQEIMKRWKLYKDALQL